LVQSADPLNTKGEQGIPVAKLPDRVQALPGQLVLFADFKGKDDTGIPLYLVNRTGKPVEVILYNGRPFFGMEYEAEPGRWKPARAVDYPLCGNDLHFVKLLDQTYLTVPGYVPGVGFKAKVRYRIDDQATPVSNAGEGLVSHDDLSYLLVSKSADFGLLSKVASGDFILPRESANFRPLAIRRLAEFDRAKAEVVLQRISQGSEKETARIAKETLDYLRKFGNK
jgi:hypothetical protein